MTQNETVDLGWIRSLRKAELHLHLLGAIRAETAFELARKHKVDFPVKDIRDWEGLFTSGDLSDFVDAFIRLFDLVRDCEDFNRIAREVFEDLASDGVFYAEPRVTVTSHLARGVDRDGMIEGLIGAAEYAGRELGVAIGWIVDYPRVLGPNVAERALEEAIAGRDWGVVGFDVAGYETPSGPDPSFESLYRRAREAGLGTTAHAGEIGPAANVRSAVEELNVDRVGHGIRAIDDPDLVEVLAEREIPLEICPSSNVRLRGVDRLENHPVERLRKAGVPITLNTDDPTLFGVSLSEEILDCARVFGWSRATVQEVIANGWKYRFRNKLFVPTGGG